LLWSAIRVWPESLNSLFRFLSYLMTDLEINDWARDNPTKQDYQFQALEDIKHEDPEYAEWWAKQRPKEKLIVQNQWANPSCTCYSNGHIANALNILEDIELLEHRPQVQPWIRRDEFCKLRNNYKTWTSIQTMAQFFKKKGIIEWYVSIANSEQNIVAKMKKAIDNGNFMCSWSSDADWGMIKKTGEYTLRTDWKFVWHARCYVDYWSDYFWALNSFGPNRGIHGGYFKVPFDMVEGTYSKLCMIDKNDSLYFQKLKDREKAKQMIAIAKELYTTGNQEVKTYFDDIKLSANMDRLYGK